VKGKLPRRADVPRGIIKTELIPEEERKASAGGKDVWSGHGEAENLKEERGLKTGSPYQKKSGIRGG